MSRRWRVGVAGLGHWYSAFGLARALPEYPRAELVGVACPDVEHLEEFCQAFDVPGTTNYDELIARDDIDIVHIASPVSDMARLAIAAARAGKHMVLGKPMAMTLAEADAMVEAVEQAGVACLPFQSLMRLRGAALKARIDRGEIGDLVVMHQASRWSIAEDWLNSGRPGWFADPAHVPGGAFIDEGIYWIDMFRWLAGSEVLQVEARMRNLVHRDLEVEDWGHAVFTFANGIVATLEAAWTINAPQPTGPSPKHNSVVRLEVVGTRGELIDQWFRDPGLSVLGAGASQWVFERQASTSFGPTTPFPLDCLVTSLDRGEPLATTIRDARASFAVALAAYASARAGAPITGSDLRGVDPGVRPAG